MFLYFGQKVLIYLYFLKKKNVDMHLNFHVAYGFCGEREKKKKKKIGQTKKWVFKVTLPYLILHVAVFLKKKKKRKKKKRKKGFTRVYIYIVWSVSTLFVIISVLLDIKGLLNRLGNILFEL